MEELKTICDAIAFLQHLERNHGSVTLPKGTALALKAFAEIVENEKESSDV